MEARYLIQYRFGEQVWHVYDFVESIPEALNRRRDLQDEIDDDAEIIIFDTNTHSLVQI